MPEPSSRLVSPAMVPDSSTTMPPKRTGSEVHSDALVKQLKSEHPEELSNAVEKELLSLSRTIQVYDRRRVSTLDAWCSR
jgi:hypothetical protein